MTENIGSTTTVNNDAHVRVWTAQIPADATYNITTDGPVNGFINPHLAFGHSSPVGFMVWVFVAMFVVGLIGSIVSAKWSGRARRKAAAGVVARFPEVPEVMPSAPPLVTPASMPSAAYEPSGEGVRLERLKTLAALRDSGALTEAEFEAEKRRILGER